MVFIKNNKVSIYMKLFVMVHPGSSKNTIILDTDIRGNTIYHVYISAKPIDGAANIMLIDMLALHI